MRREAKPILCYVTDRRALQPAGSEPLAVALVETIRRVATGGIDWIQIREKDTPARELAALTSQAIQAAGSRTRVIVNDRLDVALATQASGVHLGGTSLPVAEVRRWCATHAPSDFLIGVSCHSLNEAQAAERDGSDYVFFGPVFATPSKVTYGPPQGIERLRDTCGGVRIPVIAIGGITVENAVACFRAGAAGIAAIRLFQQTADPAAIVAQLRQT